MRTTMTDKELPKRRFALEEKDLAVEADENNKVAEEKENKFLKKIQEDATSNIEHLPDEKILDRLPNPTGWRMLVLPYKGQGKTKGGVILTDETMQERGYTTVTGLVLKMGTECYDNKERFPNGPWCKKGDWIIFGRYAGSRFGIEGGEVRILNDDEIIAVVKDPEDILQFR
jgi:co-chaperonin GroES (HSP10)